MSAWKLLARNLYAIGGSGSSSQFNTGIIEAECINSGLTRLKTLGYAVHTREVKPAHGRSPYTWTLTPLGRAWVEGRVVLARKTNRQRATWLSALPIGVRIEQRPAA